MDSSIWFETFGNELSRQSAYHLNLVRRPTKLKESRTVKSFKDRLDNIIKAKDATNDHTEATAIILPGFLGVNIKVCSVV